MANTLLLDAVTWDLVKDANGNIAVAGPPYSLAQDAASAIQTWLGECYWDQTIGVNYRLLFSPTASIQLIKAQITKAALTVEGVASAAVFITARSNRSIAGQVQVTSTTGVTTAATFNVVNPQGTG